MTQKQKKLVSNVKSILFYGGFWAFLLMFIPYLWHADSISWTVYFYIHLMSSFGLLSLVGVLLHDTKVKNILYMFLTAAIWPSVIIVTFLLGLVYVFCIPGMMYFKKLHYRLLSFSANMILQCGFFVRIRYHGTIPKGGPYIITPNHTSFIDYYLSACMMGLRRYTIVHGRNLHKQLPVVGSVIKRHFISLDRAKKSEGVIAFHQMKYALAKKEHVLIYVEGTRLTLEDRRTDVLLNEFKKGAFVASVETQTAILPVVFWNASRVCPKGGWFIKPGVVDIYYLEPISPAGLTPEMLRQKTYESMLLKITELKKK